MARIRTIKPEYFRHEVLQDLETVHPELHPMLVFAGLWGQCDKNGVFEYKPRQLKLDILPFLEYDMSASLTLLREAKLISLMVHGEKIYGYVPTFKDHQRVSGKEAQDVSKYPQPTEMTELKQEGSGGEAAGKQQGRQEGKGTEGNGVGEGNGKSTTPPTRTELAFLKAFAEKEDELKRLFPEHNYDVEKETCVAHYRTHSPPIDPYVVIIKWFRRARSEKPQAAATQDHHQTEADLRAKGLLE